MPTMSVDVALRVLGLPTDAQPTEEELQRRMDRDALKILSKPKMSEAYTVLMKSMPKKMPEPETPRPKRKHSPEPESPAKVQQHPIARIFKSMEDELSRLGQKRWAGDVEWAGDTETSSDDVTGALYAGSETLEELRKNVESTAREPLTPELLSRVLAVAGNLLSANWTWLEGVPHMLISQNKEILASSSARLLQFLEQLALCLARRSFPSYVLPPRPADELETRCLDLVSLFGAGDKFLAECRLLRRPAMPLAEVRQAMQTRTSKVVTEQLLLQLAALSEDLLAFRWARPKPQGPAHLEVMQQGLTSTSQPVGREQLAKRLARFQATMASAAASGTLPCKEMPPQPTGKVI
eukprot:TRINITY_DN14149_c0_g3_i1.p1 TRINITY_DN14149_c0_g3~~TRINITY_DN14149_c0_g3_i1.p1  ORF type:complete len:352 (+),score=60.77 TRINITY_DN14149_c0_g3_i1:66-1121(+)